MQYYNSVNADEVCMHEFKRCADMGARVRACVRASVRMCMYVGLSYRFSY